MVLIVGLLGSPMALAQPPAPVNTPQSSAGVTSEPASSGPAGAMSAPATPGEQTSPAFPRAEGPPVDVVRRRLALVIGNAGYRPALRNPRNDARGVQTALSSIGWEVTEWEDLEAADVQSLTTRFANSVAPDDEVVVYYSGHGVQLGGENFLLPVDVDFATDNDVRLNALALSSLLELLDGRRPHTLIVILDACRDNPFPPSFQPTSRGGLKKGLAAVASPPARSLIAFAASEGKTASDGVGTYGTFTQALLEQLGRPYVSAIEVLTEVNRAVRERTDEEQVPEVRWTLDYPFRFNPQPIPPPQVRTLGGGKVAVTFVTQTVTHSLVPLGTSTQVENLARKAVATSVAQWREVLAQEMVQLNDALRGLAAVDAAARECVGPEFAADARRLRNAHSAILNAIDALELPLAQDLSSAAIDDTPGACIPTDWQQIGFYTATGVAVAGVAMGGALLYYANDTWREALDACPGNEDGACPDDRGPRLARLARKRADVATGAFVAGGVGLGAALGIWLYQSFLSTEEHPVPDERALSVRVSGGAGVFSVDVGGTF